MKFIDFFAGIGGFRRGMELAGHECVGFCEFDKFAVASYTSMHLITDTQRETLSGMPIKQRQKEILKDEYRNGEWYANDIRSVRADEIPRADCWCFGFPCQDISIAGKQEGFNGHRSSLFFAVTRLIRDLEEEDRPKYLFIENVKNLLSINRGGDFLKLLIELDEIGYDAEWQLLNSKDFGVPQNRERVFIIGHLRGRSTGKVFPVDGTSTENSIYQLGKVFRPNRDNPNAGRTYGVKGIAPCLGTMEGGKERPQHERIYDTNGVMTALNSQLGGRHNIAVPINIEEDMILDGNNFNQRKVVHGNGSISRTLIGCGHSGNEPKVAIPILTPDRAEKRQNGRRFKENGKPMFTLAAQDRHGVGIGVRYTENGFHLYRKDKKKSTIQGTHVTCQNGNVQCLGTSHIPMTMEKIGIIDPQGRNNKEVFPEDICPTLRSETHGNVPNVCVNIHETSNYGNGIYVEMPEGFIVYAIWYEKEHCYITIRKLTPKECFRLQGWTDDYFERAAFVNSDSRLYMQAGNGVTVDVVYAIGKRILCA